MKDILQDVVAKTHSLGFLNLVKVTGDDAGTIVESMAEDRSVILTANTKEKVAEFGANIFGMPNLDKLALHLKNPEYQKNSKLTITEQERNGNTVPTGIHFENEAGDFQNDFRFMMTEIINEKLKSVKFKGATWDVEFTPSLASITRLKLQSAAHSEETTFTIRVEQTGDAQDVMFYFGDVNTHAGKFVFQSNVPGNLKHAWTYPIAQVQAILNLDGQATMSLSDQGAMQITVDSGLGVYNYILPAQSK
jgi:hypothetical protein|tara:strand:- start:294 stop:1040 length:747 start_codon:yes stop_codon:yes gene_type:complete